MLKVDEIVALQAALISEKKNIVVVCEDCCDLIPVVQTIIDNFYPFDWVLPRVPYLISNPKLLNYEGFEAINGIQHIVIGIHKSSYNYMKDKIIEGDYPETTIVVDLSNIYI